MSPSSNPPVPERVIVCQRGSELAEFASLLAELGVPVEVHTGPLPTVEQVVGAALVIVPGQRLAEGKAALQRWPRTIAVVDDGSRTLIAHLARLGVSVILRRPVHPRALRLLILHALYRGPERRSKQRVMIGQPIRAGVGLFKQDATLLELSRTGARIELASPPKIGTLIQFVLGKELTLGKPIKVQAKVVRAIRALEPSGRGTGEIGLALVDPGGEHARVIQGILERHASHSASTTTAGRTAPDKTPARSQARPVRAAQAVDVARSGAGVKPSTRPFATAALTSLSRSLSSPTPTTAPAAPAPTRSTGPTASRPARPFSEPRGLPPRHEPERIAPAPFEPDSAGQRATSTSPVLESSSASPVDAVVPVESALTEVEILDADVDSAFDATLHVELGAELETDLDRLDGDESDLDFELELDDEVEAGKAGSLVGADILHGAGSALVESAPGRDGEATLEAERRESTRVAYSQRVVALDEQAARVVVGRDLSPGGMRIAPNAELAVGDVVKLALHAGTETESLVVLAGVERDDGEDGLLLAFAALTSGQRERLGKILAATSSILSTDPLDEGHEGESIVMGEVLRRVARGPVSTVRAGFTLIELMIVVALIGIISSVAIPIFGRYQLRSKSSEVKTNLSAIRIVQEAHQSEHGRYLAANAEPPLIPGPRPVAFDITGTDYAEMGWSPEGRVYFSYAVAVSPDATGYTADAAADIDGNGILQIWGIAKPDPLGALTTGGLGCNPAVLDAREIGSCVVGASAF